MESDDKIEESTSQNAQELKPDKKKSKLEVVGYVMFGLAAVFFAVCLWVVANGSYGDDFGLFVVFMVIAFGFFSIYPAILFSLLASIFTGLSIKHSKTALVTFILSLVILILTLGYFVASLVIISI